MGITPPSGKTPEELTHQSVKGSVKKWEENKQFCKLLMLEISHEFQTVWYRQLSLITGTVHLEKQAIFWCDA